MEWMPREIGPHLPTKNELKAVAPGLEEGGGGGGGG